MKSINEDKLKFSRDYKSCDSEPTKYILLVEKLREHFAQSDRNKLISYLHSYEFFNTIKDFTYEILAYAVQHLKAAYDLQDKESLWRWNNLIIFLVINSEPSEMLLYLTEQMELHILTSNYYNLFLKPLKLCACKCKNPALLVDMYVNSIKDFLLYLPVSINADIETIILSYIGLSNFTDNLYTNLSIIQNSSLYKENFKYSILNLLLSMFGNPLCFLRFDLDFLEILIKKIYKNIFTIECDFIHFFRFINFKDFNTLSNKKDNHFNCEVNQIMQNIDKLSLFNFYWLCFRAKTKLNILSVYNPYYIVNNCLYLSNYCIKYANCNNIILFKIFDLVLNSLNIIQKLLIPHEDLELLIHSELLTNLSNIIIYNSTIEIRKKAVNVFILYINTFDDAAKFRIIQKFLALKYSSKIKSIVIGILKNMVVENSLNPLKQIWLKNKFSLLFDILFNLAETDILEISDQLITLLNLILFLTLKDDKYSGIIKFFEETDYKFLKVLINSVNLQKEEWLMKLKNLEKESNLVLVDEQIVQNNKIMFHNQVINTLLIVENIVQRITETIGINLF